MTPAAARLVTLEPADTAISRGFVGTNLAKLQQDRFQTATRAEVCLGFAIAATDLLAELLIAAAAIARLRSQIDWRLANDLSI